MEKNNGYVPKHLDNLPRFILWDVYQILIFFIFFGFGVTLHMMLTGFVTGAFLSWIYGKVSQGQGKGMLVHLLYWFTSMGNGYKVLPPSHKRNFQG